MALTYTPRRLSSTAREALYDRCRGDKEFPDCNICGLPVDGVHQAWDESHDPDGPPHCFGGTETGVAHRECNRRHGAKVVVPMDAKATRVRQNHIGAAISRFPLPGGRNSHLKRKVGGGVVPRQARVAKASFAPPAPAGDADLDAQLAAVTAEMVGNDPAFEAWLDRVAGLLEGRIGTVFGSALTTCGNALMSFEEGVTADCYALQLQAMRGAV